MRNSTKKITAIAAALLLSVSGVATTAAMATPVFAVTADSEAPAASKNTLKVSDDTEEKSLNSNTPVTTTGATISETGYDYAFGTAIKPLDGVTKVTIKLSDDTTIDVSNFSIDYENNVDVTKEGESAYAIISIVNQKVEVSGTTYTINGKYYVPFTINAYDLKDAQTVKTKSVKATWTGDKISIKKSELPLTRTVAAADGTEYQVEIDSDLYTITSIGGKTVTEKNGVLTFDCPDAPNADGLDVIFAPAKNVTVLKASDDDAGKAEKIVVIEKANWSDVVLNIGDQTSALTANVTATLNGVNLTVAKNGAVPVVAASTGVEGDATLAQVTVTPNQTYFDVVDDYNEIYYANIGTNIASKISSVTLTDTTTKSYTYTGEEIKPEVTVKAVSGTTLTEGVDYEVVYSNNVNKGTAKVTIKGIGTYAGEVTGPSFTITQKKLSETTVETTDVAYDKALPTVADLAKAITVKNGDVELVYGTDFTVSLVGTVKEGENTLKILPVTKDADGNAVTPNYTGSTSATVNVVKVADISTAEIATIANVAYTGEAQTPALTVTLGDKTLVEGTDYTVEYTNNTEVGCATATITGIGAYTGTNARNFVIVPQQVTGLKAVKKTATTLKLQFNAVEGADGYKIYDAETGKAIASVSTQNGADVLKKTITGLNAGETRKYKVRAYKIVNGTKRYAEYSAVYTKATATK
jgi:hypothetical protein